MKWLVFVAAVLAAPVCPFIALDALSHIQLGNPGEFAMAIFTVSMWLKLPSTNTTKHIFNVQAPPPAISLGLTAFSDTLVVWLGGFSDLTNNQTVRVTWGNEWVNLVVRAAPAQSYNTTFNISVFYADGSRDNSSFTLGTQVSPGLLAIGKGDLAMNAANKSQGLEGYMTQFIMYNRQVEAGEVEDLHCQANFSVTAPTLLLYEDWPSLRLVELMRGTLLTFSGDVHLEIGSGSLCSAPVVDCTKNSTFTCPLTQCPNSGPCFGGRVDVNCMCPPGFTGDCSIAQFGCSNNSYGNFGDNVTYSAGTCDIDLIATDFTVSVWVRSDTWVDFNPVFSTDPNGMHLSLSASGFTFGLRERTLNFTYGSPAMFLSTVALRWHLVIARFTNATGRMELIVDGQRVYSDTEIAPLADLSPGDFQIGKLSLNSTVYYYSGRMDDLLVWRRFLGELELSALLQRQMPPAIDLLLFLDFDASGDLSPLGLPIRPPLPVASADSLCAPPPLSQCSFCPDLCGIVNGTVESCICVNERGFYDNSTSGGCFYSSQPKCPEATPWSVSTAHFNSSCLELGACGIDWNSSFSVELWVKRTSTESSTIFSANVTSLRFVNDTLVFARAADAVSFTCRRMLNRWHHVVGVSRGSSLLLYVDGVLEQSTTTTAFVSQSSGVMYLGCETNGSDFLGGELSLFRVYSRDLNDSDVRSHFQDSFTAENSAGTVVDLLLSQDLIDRAPILQRRAVVSLANDVAFTTARCLPQSASPCIFSPCQHGSCLSQTQNTSTCACYPGFFGSQCESIGCDNSSVSSPYGDFDGATYFTANCSFPTLPNFTMGVWMKLSANTSGQPRGVYGEVAQNRVGLSLGVSSAGELILGDLDTFIAAPCFPAQEWHFVVGVVSNDSTLQLYVDSVLTGAVTFSPVSSCNYFTVGAWTQNGTVQPFLGQLDELRLFANMALSSMDITNLMLKNSLGPIFPEFHFGMEDLQNPVVLANSTPLQQPDVRLNLTTAGVCFHPTPPTMAPTTQVPTPPTTQAPTRTPTTAHPTTSQPTFVSTSNVLKVYGSSTDPYKLIPLPLTSLEKTALDMQLPPYFAFTIECVADSNFVCANDNTISVQSDDITDLEGQPITSIGPKPVPLTFRNRYNGTMTTIDEGNQSQFILDGLQFVWSLKQEQICPVAFWPCNLSTYCCSCPIGGSCTGAKTILAQDGYVRANETFFLECQPASACALGVCTPHYTNVAAACNVCAENHYRRNGACVNCPEAAEFVLFVGVVVFLVIVFIILKLARIQDSRTFSLAITIGFIQLLSLFATLPFAWPQTTLAMFDVFSFSNFNADLFSPECAVHSSTYWSRWVLKMLFPVLAISALGITYLGVKHSRRLREAYLTALYFDPLRSLRTSFHRLASESEGGREKDTKWERENLSARFVAAVTHIVCMLYTFLCKISTDPLNCAQREDGTYFLAVDPAVGCYDNDWNSHVFLSVLGILVYMVGIPVFFLVILCRTHSRQELDTPHIHARYGSLIIPYRSQFWYWEIVQMMRKLSIVVLVNFGSNQKLNHPSTTQINGLVLALLLFLAAQEFANPYQLAWCNRVSFAWTISCILVLGAAIIFQSKVLSSIETEGYAAGLVLACICSSVVSVICFFKERKRNQLLSAITPGISKLERERAERQLLVDTFGATAGNALFRKARGLTPQDRTTFIEKISADSGTARLQQIEMEAFEAKSEKDFVDRYGSEIGGFLFVAVAPTARADFLTFVEPNEPLLSQSRPPTF